MWNLETLSKVPGVYGDPSRSDGDVQAIFYDGLPYRGKPTRIFAYYGIPSVKPGEKVPAMVLVHGGGGSAFIPWVRLWLSRGYAAISMDTCGCISSGGYAMHPRHEDGGPPGWGGFDQIGEPVEDQWAYHAIADVLLAHSLIRSFPQVAADKIGITGISWGGYLTCITAGVDTRFRFAAPVYGCGFLGDNSTWLWQGEFGKMGSDNAKRWLNTWDPSVYLRKARMPVLWVTGTNDFAFPMDSLQKSYRVTKGERTLCVRVRMPHGHGGAGENPAEIPAYANSLFRGSDPLPRILESGREGPNAWAEYESVTDIAKAELNYTTSTGKWPEREWKTVDANIDKANHKVSAIVPPDASLYYFNLFDTRDLAVSSEHEERLPTADHRLQ